MEKMNNMADPQSDSFKEALSKRKKKKRKKVEVAEAPDIKNVGDGIQHAAKAVAGYIKAKK